jgi:hypothetical protein
MRGGGRLIDDRVELYQTLRTVGPVHYREAISPLRYRRGADLDTPVGLGLGG